MGLVKRLGRKARRRYKSTKKKGRNVARRITKRSTRGPVNRVRRIRNSVRKGGNRVIKKSRRTIRRQTRRASKPVKRAVGRAAIKRRSTTQRVRKTYRAARKSAIRRTGRNAGIIARQSKKVRINSRKALMTAGSIPSKVVRKAEQGIQEGLSDALDKVNPMRGLAGMTKNPMVLGIIALVIIIILFMVFKGR